jgi:hypothetical protein
MRTLHAVALETEVEKKRLNSLLDGGHYLKTRQPSGHTLYQAVLDKSVYAPRQNVHNPHQPDAPTL